MMRSLLVLTVLCAFGQDLIPIPVAPVPLPNIQVVIISHKNCPPCVDMLKVVQKELPPAGWDFNGKHFTIVNHTGKEGLPAYPTMLRYVDGKATNIHSGLLTRDQLTDFFYTGKSP